MSSYKPQEALRLGLNVLIDGSCEGDNCNWHKFPYEIQSIITDDNRKKIKFDNNEDVWGYITRLDTESKENKPKGSSFSTLNDIWEQLPFFVCSNNLISEKAQSDISRYIYTKEANTPSYPGSYGDTPHIWIQKYFIIKQAMILRDKKLREKVKNGNN